MKQNKYEVIDGNVIVTCRQGHENQAQQISDRLAEQTLVCANTSCKAQWTQTLPQISSLEQRDEAE